jgi:hypothetical protein
MSFKSPISIVAAKCSEQLSNRVIKCDSNLILVRKPYSEQHLLDDINSPEYTMTDENKKPHQCWTDINKNYAAYIMRCYFDVQAPLAEFSNILELCCRLDKLDEAYACFHPYTIQAS